VLKQQITGGLTIAEGRVTCFVSWNLINCCPAVQKITFENACSWWMTLTLRVTRGHQKWRCLMGCISLPVSGL